MTTFLVKENKELFVVSGWILEFNVCDSIEFSFSRRWDSKELVDPWDIRSCMRKNVSPNIHLYQPNEISRGNPLKKLIKKWPKEDEIGRVLSVTDESNFILKVFLKLN